MFTCEVCDKCFTRKDNLVRHQNGYCKPISNLCEACGIIFSSEGHFRKHQKEIHGIIRKRKAEQMVDVIKEKRIRIENITPEEGNMKRCDHCEIDIPKKYMAQHYRSLQHKSKICEVRGAGISLIKHAFKNRIATYRITPNENKVYVNVKEFMQALQPKIISSVLKTLDEHIAIKMNIELFGLFILPSKDLKEVKSFNTKFKICSASTDMDYIYKNAIDEIDNKVSEFQEKESGWSLENLLFIELNINKYNPLKASSYIELPKNIYNKEAIINIQNTDNKCFMWSVLASLHPVKDNACRITHYQKYENELNFSGIEFPVKLKDITKFEKQNPSISINVYGLDLAYKDGKTNAEVAGPLYFTKAVRDMHVNLLIVDDNEGNSHYCLIKNLAKLVGPQLSKHEHKKFLCDGCLISFNTEVKLHQHKQYDCNHIRVQLPTTEPRVDKFGNTVPGNILKFENFEKKLKVPFVVYADFESVSLPIQYCQPSNEESFTEKTHIHQPYSFAYYIKCSYDDNLSKLETYRGQDCAEVFYQLLEGDIKRIYNTHLKPIIPMKPLTSEQELAHKLAVNCHICDKSFHENEQRVHDHCHLTGTYRGAAHSQCNLNYKNLNFIPVFLHNLTGYDSHLFIKSLAADEEKIDVIAENKEKYISFSKHVAVDTIKNKFGYDQRVYIKMRFLDSFRFMPSSLEKLAENLEEYPELKSKFPELNDEKFKLLSRKGVFPYSFMDSFDKLSYTQLPTREQFYNELKREEISETDYQRAQTVWQTFNCKTMGDYSDVYLKTDVLLLADIFENFRKICMNTYQLDPCHFFTAPGLTWAAMLKLTKVELELLTDIDMVHFIKKGIRGGVAQCSKRYVKANNQYMPKYDKSKPTSFINYLDATNLYGKALSSFLPINSFKFLTEMEISKLDILNIPENSETGYILEVDLSYPEHLHDYHNDLPFCPENIVPPGAKLPKLIPNLYNKDKYVIHYRNLQQCVEAGMILNKIHRVLSFTQSTWLKKYIDLNTEMRNTTKTAFGKMFFKLMNNAVFGKTMENVDNRTDIRLITHWENIGRKLGAETYISKPHFKDSAIFSENLVAIHMERLKVTYDKPIYIGFCVLDLAKHVIYDFYYNFIKKSYGDKVKLAYTDTDSLILETSTEDFYEDIKNNLDKYDTSNFKENNQFGIPQTPSVIGKMKDEYAGEILQKFIGTGAKAYIIDCGGVFTKTAKGIQKNVIEKELTSADYENVVLNNVDIYKTVRSFRSYEHQLYTELRNKVALSWKDDKRYIIPDGTGNTMAWGHHKLQKQS